jgi:23S rRNA (adenine2503-C2)-methyltransferase
VHDIKELTLEELKSTLKDWGKAPFHAKQIFFWIYHKGVSDFNQMSDLPLDLRRQLKEKFYLSSLRLIKSVESRDGTEKLLFELQDKNLIEAVIIPAKDRITGCVSTQVGCKFSCFFCASGLLGFKRNLTQGEIIEQVLYLKNKSKHRLTHLVFMGMGEPLDNYDFAIKAIRIINSPEGMHIGARRITISTCGITPGIKKLSGEGLQIELSVSLHAADDKTRTKIMPVNKKYPLKELMSACREYVKQTNRQVTFEYILIKGLNSDLQSAANLSKILKGWNCKVNLIPSNVVKECRIEPPNKMDILFFKDCLVKQGINVTLRKPRGEDIEAACGQLRLKTQISNIKNQNDNSKIKNL